MVVWTTKETSPLSRPNQLIVQFKNQNIISIRSRSRISRRRKNSIKNRISKRSRISWRCRISRRSRGPNDVISNLWVHSKEPMEENTGQSTALHSLNCTVLWYTALLSTTLHCTALHCSALHFTALNCTALHCNVLSCTTLHCIADYCTALQRWHHPWGVPQFYPWLGSLVSYWIPQSSSLLHTTDTYRVK